MRRPLRTPRSLVVIAGLVVAAGLALACSRGPAEAGAPAAGAGLPDRDPALACALVRDQRAIILDVRTEEEFAAGHVEGAVLIPHDQLPTRLAELDALSGGDKSRPIVTYCRSGRRSAIAKETLLDAGYGQVTNLGGVKEWRGC